MTPRAEGNVETTAPSSAIAPSRGARLATLDWMRGLVMVLMAVDHSSGEFNAGRLVTDSAFMYHRGTALPALQFLTRWITHLCAPTFVFLAGASLAMSLRRRVARGERAASIDGYLLIRGLLIMGFEVVPSYFWMPPRKYLLQVLYGIGSSFLFMIPLRRLPTAALAVIALAILFLGELVVGLAGWGPPDKTPLLVSLLLTGGPRGALMIGYPTLPWLAIMLLGFVFGTAVAERRVTATPRLYVAAGVALLGVFAFVRGLNGYGNMALLRDGDSVVQWLHVSKYPPSVSYVGLELGIMAFCLAGFAFIALRAPSPDGTKSKGVLTVLGHTPMFFYLLHIPLLAVTAHLLGLEHKLGIVAAFGFAAATVLVLYPACLWYTRYKASHPHGWTRYL
jgi:uncharacterized membrane protein